MDDGKAREIVCPSAGVHVILPDYYSPSNMGLLDPATSDGRYRVATVFTLFTLFT